MVLLGLQAAAWRVPFLPTRVGLGSDLFRVDPELRTVRSPYPSPDGGEPARSWSPCRRSTSTPRSCHLNVGDERGNAAFLGPDLYFDDLMLEAAEQRFVSVERIVPTEDLGREAGDVTRLRISRLFVDGVVEAPERRPLRPRASPTTSGTRRSSGEYAAHRQRPDAWDAFRAEWLSLPDEADLPRQGDRSFGGRRPMSGDVAPGPTCARSRWPSASGATASCLANPIGTIPMIGGRLARATFEPDLMMTDGEATLIANDEAAPARPTRGGRDLEPVPAHVRRGLERPAPRDDGRHAGRPVRQPEHRRASAPTRTRRRCSCSASGRAGQHDQRHHQLLGAEPRAQGVRRARRRGRAASATTGPPSSARRRPLPRDPAGRVQPRRVRLRDRRPPHAAALGAPRRHASTRWSRPPASSSTCPTTCPSRRLPTAEELELLARSSTPPAPAPARCPTRPELVRPMPPPNVVGPVH